MGLLQKAWLQRSRTLDVTSAMCPAERERESHTVDASLEECNEVGGVRAFRMVEFDAPHAGCAENNVKASIGTHGFLLLRRLGPVDTFGATTEFIVQVGHAFELADVCHLRPLFSLGVEHHGQQAKDHDKSKLHLAQQSLHRRVQRHLIVSLQKRRQRLTEDGRKGRGQSSMRNEA